MKVSDIAHNVQVHRFILQQCRSFKERTKDSIKNINLPDDTLNGTHDQQCETADSGIPN